MDFCLWCEYNWDGIQRNNVLIFLLLLKDEEYLCFRRYTCL